VSAKAIERFLDILLSGDDEMRKTSNPRLQFEYLLVKMAGLEPVIPVDEMVSRLEKLESRLMSTWASMQNQTEEMPKTIPPEVTGVSENGTVGAVSEASLGADEVRDYAVERKTRPAKPNKTADVWTMFMERLRSENPILFSKMTAGTHLGTEEGVLRIGFPGKFVFLENLREPEAAAMMNRLAGQCAGREMLVNIEEITDRGDGNGTGKSQIDKRSVDEMKSEALRHPMVQKVMDVFEGAEIRDVKIRNGST
ncbi:MAG: hypothetical protein PHU03_03090, partial [Syntrophales bacterium]|nr:hypothetical protein [Syntrophales bacterium]